MGRGGNLEAGNATTLRGLREVRSGQRFRSIDDGSEIEIVWAAEGWGHVGVTVRDRLGIKVLRPQTLRERYESISDGDGEVFSLDPPEAIENPSPSLFAGDSWEEVSEHLRKSYGIKTENGSADTPMSKRQAEYLKRLCEDAGQSFDSTLTKRQASKRIDELKPAA